MLEDSKGQTVDAPKRLGRGGGVILAASMPFLKYRECLDCKRLRER